MAWKEAPCEVSVLTLLLELACFYSLNLRVDHFDREYGVLSADLEEKEPLLLIAVNKLSPQLLPSNFDLQLEQVLRKDWVEQKKCTDQWRKD